MPVKSTTAIDSLYFSDSSFFLHDDYDPITVDDVYELTPVLPDDIWKKFDLDFPFAADIPGLSDPEALSSCLETTVKDQLCLEIRNHDCMWAGHCGSKEHPADETPLYINRAVAVAPGPAYSSNGKTPAQRHGRSLLLRTAAAKQAPIVPLPLIQSPESPPISDDEGRKQTNSILKALNDAIEECDLDEDSDLCEYFEDGEDVVGDPGDDEEEDEEDASRTPSPHNPQPVQMKASFTPEIDHSYHKGKLPHADMAGLGIDTPSDSEEEIDVESVGEKQTVLSNRLSFVLPNNPTFRDRQHLQRTMASAIHCRQQQQQHDIPEKLKGTSMPPIFVKPPPCVTDGSPTKRHHHLSEQRSVKRNKISHYRTTAQNGSPYKRRLGYGHSSDSEPEPLEKRSLHNNMERQRRIDLRNAFEDLRVLVPEVCHRERAPKVVILREAAAYCDRLGEVSTSMHRQIEELRKHQEKLRTRVSQLRRCLAAKR